MTSITEITGMEGDVISMQEIFRFQRVGLTPDNKIIGHFTATGVRSHYSERFRLWGFDLPPLRFMNPPLMEGWRCNCLQNHSSMA